MREWLNSTVLPEGAQWACKEGLYAELHDDGQLLHLGYYEDGACDDCWALYLEHGVEKGKARLRNGSGGSADYEIYSKGSAELFDAWSDNSPVRPMSYEKWVRDWVARIAKISSQRQEAKALGKEARARIAREGKRAMIKAVPDPD
ncbi:MAG: hypothetical protein FJ090_09740 [Deltaproteobacteria bacterium]|nr:hypothetical protein [Deltaproteobacteria bacterium]